MDFRPELWMLERMGINAADYNGLMDGPYIELLQQKIRVRSEFDKKFEEWLAQYLASHPLPVDINKGDLRGAVTNIRDQYFYGFCKKLALGERYLELHPGTTPKDNIGYKIGSSQIDVMTHDAMALLTRQFVYDDTGRPLDIDDATAVMILGRVIPAVLGAALQSLPISGLAGQASEVFVVDPQVRLLPRGSDIPALIDGQPEAGARGWADQKTLGLLEKIRAARQQTRSL